jgi:hypothetical protein
MQEKEPQYLEGFIIVCNAEGSVEFEKESVFEKRD